MDTEKIINYHLYIDECGDQNLETFSSTFPIFTLCGILVRDDLVALLEEQVRALKQEFWGDRQIILHSRDIRKCQNGFEVLFDLDLKRRFYEFINQLLGQRGVYVIVSCSILKEPYIRQLDASTTYMVSRFHLCSNVPSFALTTSGQTDRAGFLPLWSAEANVRTKIS